MPPLFHFSDVFHVPDGWDWPRGSDSVHNLSPSPWHPPSFCLDTGGLPPVPRRPSGLFAPGPSVAALKGNSRPLSEFIVALNAINANDGRERRFRIGTIAVKLALSGIVSKDVSVSEGRLVFHRNLINPSPTVTDQLEAKFNWVWLLWNDGPAGI